MKKNFNVHVPVIVMLLACNNSVKPKANEWVVNKTATACNCIVQLSTASPIGDRFLGPYKTKEEAIKEMCKNVDPELQDNKKCWTTKPECK